MSQSVFRKWWFWALIVVLLVFVFLTFVVGSDEGRVETSFAEFTEDLRAGQVAKVEIDGNEIIYNLTGDDTKYKTEMTEGISTRSGGISAEDAPEINIVRDDGTWGTVSDLSLRFLPIVAIVGILAWLVWRSARKQG